MLGLVGGTVLLLSLVAGSLVSAWLILMAARASVALVTVNVATRLPGSTAAAAAAEVVTLAVTLLEVLLVKSSLALQLLCTVAMQMAKLLERRRMSLALVPGQTAQTVTPSGAPATVNGVLQPPPRHQEHCRQDRPVHILKQRLGGHAASVAGEISKGGGSKLPGSRAMDASWARAILPARLQLPPASCATRTGRCAPLLPADAPRLASLSPRTHAPHDGR